MMNAGMGKKRRLKKIGNLARFVKIEQETTANSPKKKKKLQIWHLGYILRD